MPSPDMFAVAEPSFPVSYPRLSEIPPTTFPIAHGCLLGGAVGDALGAAVEELTLAEIRDRYGRDGYRGKVAEYSNQPTEFTGRTSEESQLALLMVEAMIRSSVRARDRGTGAPTVGMLQAMGAGWTAPEALAMAVYAALTAESVGGTPQQIVERGLRAAVNHSGDSDATGAMCGNLLGARYGYQAIPEDWAGACEIAGPVWALAQDFTMEFGPRPPVGPDYYIDPHWAARFHG
ncbi:ADP-ribosylglycohydrolase family protein [Nocardia cyriacigeorgica]|nr:ADP-ribosylglycohydrolase family protein [Nocardia cyriacigeorgica]